MSSWLAMLLGLAGGAMGVYWWQNRRTQAAELARAQLEQKLLLLETDRQQLRADAAVVQDRLQLLQEEKSQLSAENRQLNLQLQRHDEQLKAQWEQLQVQFKNVANELLESKSKTFSERNQQQLDQVLQPLRERLKTFEAQVQQSHQHSIAQHASLYNELKTLKELNQQMSDEARNLTRALKGENKTQGNWGEVILQRVLERSGLRLGQEYQLQVGGQSEEGRRLQPDVTILLPEQKYLVIDSKVSLTDYERYVNAETPVEQEAALKKHLQSMRRHVQGLSSKSYDQLYGPGSPDFVLLFVPIEPAFIAAVQQDGELFNEAFDQNIVIVSTSTLLATLRTIASIWRQENQNRNALEIARQAGNLYDKFISFTADLKKVGAQLELASKSHEQALNKLSEGKDNLVRKAERLRELGAKTSKKQDDGLLGEAFEASEDHSE